MHSRQKHHVCGEGQTRAWAPLAFENSFSQKRQHNDGRAARSILVACCKPSDQPRDAARWEECSSLDEKSLTTFCRCDGRAKGVC